MPSLLLHPDKPDWIADDRAEFVGLLGDLGLIDVASAAGDPSVYCLGHQFLTLVMFLGCSPHVLIDPRNAGEGQPVSDLRYHNYPEPRFLSARKPTAVRCPGCRAPASDVVPGRPNKLFTCPQCGRVSAVGDLDWRRSAGLARCFLEITGIYPHEAVPSDVLMDRLRGYSGSAWRYFYID